ncbi:melanocyte-stimulating hormone receptor-like [Alosa sapidissima]|uniref:melanocyte-stimulating hormone receptor-like n=1 Tax=Alosa sapidissima TaxID=34773 RepID=UPI001C09FFF9|nr:melanocyte-stimulating hormone receptor-like [Alosa sapidissima]
MEEPYNQTSAYITPTHTYIPTHTHMSDFENNVTYYNDTLQTHFEDIYLITDCLSFLATLLGLCFVVYGLYALVKTGHYSLHVFVINLFISDLIQISTKLIQISKDFLILSDLIADYNDRLNDSFNDSLGLIYGVGVMANVCFMVFISAERYIMIAYPVWYRNIHTIRTPVCVSVTVWVIFSITTIISLWFNGYIELFVLLVLLLPYPFVMFFFVGTWRALSGNTSVPRHEQRRIMGTLALVLGIYTVLFLPFVLVQIQFFHPIVNHMTLWIYLVELALILMALSPLFDFLLYLLMRRDAKYILRALCFRKRHKDKRTTKTLMEAQV